jgi:hypothetical protein
VKAKEGKEGKEDHRRIPSDKKEGRKDESGGRK